MRLIADLAIAGDGRTFARTGALDSQGRRLFEIFGSTGALQHSLAIEPDTIAKGRVAIDPADPWPHLTWWEADGVTRLLRLSPAQAP